MQTVTIKLSDDNARLWTAKLRKLLCAHGNTSLATLVETVTWRAVIEQLEKESYTALREVSTGEEQ